jgi:predicted metal-binding membrane protein
VSIVLRYPVRAVRAVQRFSWLHPEWWSIVLCALAWLAMLARHRRHSAHLLQHSSTFEEQLINWTLMVAAMMLPLVMPAVRIAANRSLWGRRDRAMAGFLVGYLAPSMGLGVLVIGLQPLHWEHKFFAAGVGFVVAAAWRATLMHRRALIACHRTQPLAPLGWRADRDCLRFGGSIGLACVRSCWPLMIACALAEHNLMTSIAATMIGVVERWTFRPRVRSAVLASLAIAGYCFLLAVFDPSISS